MSFVAIINSRNITSSRIVPRVKFVRMWDLRDRRDSVRTYNEMRTRTNQRIEHAFLRAQLFPLFQVRHNNVELSLTYRRREIAEMQIERRDCSSNSISLGSHPREIRRPSYRDIASLFIACTYMSACVYVCVSVYVFVYNGQKIARWRMEGTG